MSSTPGGVGTLSSKVVVKVEPLSSMGSHLLPPAPRWEHL
jgi:hypothetical protein